jgi:hypothetical protein
MPLESGMKPFVSKPDRASRTGAAVSSRKIAKEGISSGDGARVVSEKPEKQHKTAKPDKTVKQARDGAHVVSVQPANLGKAPQDKPEQGKFAALRGIKRSTLIGVAVVVFGVVAISVAIHLSSGGSSREPTMPEPIQECDLSSIAVVDKRPTFNDEVVCPSGWSLARSTVYDSWPRDLDECINYVGCEYAGLFHLIYAGENNKCNAPARMMDGGHSSASVKCRFPAETVGQWSLAATYGRDLELLGSKVKVIVPSQKLNDQGTAASSSCFVKINVVDSCGVPEICDPVITEAPVLLDLEAQTACRIFGCDYSVASFTVAKVNTVPKFLCYRKDGKADALP